MQQVNQFCTELELTEVVESQVEFVQVVTAENSSDKTTGTARDRICSTLLKRHFKRLWNSRLFIYLLAVKTSPGTSTDLPHLKILSTRQQRQEMAKNSEYVNGEKTHSRRYPQPWKEQLREFLKSHPHHSG